MDVAGDVARSKEKPRKRRVEGRGVVKRRLPKSETSDAEGTETESKATKAKAKTTKAKATKADKAKTKTTTKAPPPPPPPTTTSETRTKSSAGFVFVGGESREADSNRRVLVGGDAPRPRGRAPAGKPWWDTSRRRVRRGGCLLTTVGEPNPSVARNGDNAVVLFFFHSFIKHVDYRRVA